MNPDHKSHEALVVEQLTSPKLLNQFIIKWRRHFIETMKPKHLPPGWKVE